MNFAWNRPSTAHLVLITRRHFKWCVNWSKNRCLKTTLALELTNGWLVEKRDLNVSLASNAKNPRCSLVTPAHFMRNVPFDNGHFCELIELALNKLHRVIICIVELISWTLFLNFYQPNAEHSKIFCAFCPMTRISIELSNLITLNRTHTHTQMAIVWNDKRY